MYVLTQNPPVHLPWYQSIGSTLCVLVPTHSQHEDTDLETVITDNFCLWNWTTWSISRLAMTRHHWIDGFRDFWTESTAPWIRAKQSDVIWDGSGWALSALLCPRHDMRKWISTEACVEGSWFGDLLRSEPEITSHHRTDEDWNWLIKVLQSVTLKGAIFSARA